MHFRFYYTVDERNIGGIYTKKLGTSLISLAMLMGVTACGTAPAVHPATAKPKPLSDVQKATKVINKYLEGYYNSSYRNPDALPQSQSYMTPAGLKIDEQQRAQWKENLLKTKTTFELTGLKTTEYWTDHKNSIYFYSVVQDTQSDNSKKPQPQTRQIISHVIKQSDGTWKLNGEQEISKDIQTVKDTSGDFVFPYDYKAEGITSVDITEARTSFNDTTQANLKKLGVSVLFYRTDNKGTLVFLAVRNTEKEPVLDENIEYTVSTPTGRLVLKSNYTFKGAFLPGQTYLVVDDTDKVVDPSYVRSHTNEGNLKFWVSTRWEIV